MGLVGTIAARAKRLFQRDSWSSDLLGFGGANDKLADGTFCPIGQLPVSYIDLLIHQDPLCARAVGAVVVHALRQGWSFKSAHPRAEELKGWLEEEFDFSRLVELHAIMGRAYGAAAIFPMAEDGTDALTPLQVSQISNVWNLQLLDRDEMQIWEYGDVVQSREFMRPSVIRIAQKTQARGHAGLPIGMLVHSSRMIQWCLRGTPESERRNSGWCESVLTPAYESIREYNLAAKALGIQLVDANQSVYKIKNLDEALLNKESEDRLQARFDLLETARSAARAIVLDAEFEEWQRVPTQMQALSESLTTVMQKVSMAVDMPMTILFGMSPAGLNATGESDIRHWYDSVQAFRHGALERVVRRAVDICRMDKDSPLRDRNFEYQINWPSLWQLSPTEKATTRLTVAQADAIYLDKGVYEPEDVALTRMTEDGWSLDVTIDEETFEEESLLLNPNPKMPLLASNEVKKSNQISTEQAENSNQAESPSNEVTNASLPPVEDVQKTVLNGAQIASLLEIARAVGAGEIPKETAKQIILLSFPVSEEQANALLEPIEEGDTGGGLNANALQTNPGTLTPAPPQAPPEVPPIAAG